jgi:Zn-dependent protease with chaperone function
MKLRMFAGLADTVATNLTVAPKEFMGVPVRVDMAAKHCAEARGYLRWKYISVGSRWFELTGAEAFAALAHEVGHCRGWHAEIRLGMFVAAALPALYFLPWPVTAGLLASAVLFECAAEISKRQELQADAFAADRGHGPHIVAFLERCRKIPVEHDPGSFYPTLLERIEKLKGK